MRSLPTILHLDMDAFFASVEQASKPSLRGKPVIVGGLSGRGVVATASYEARRFGVHSAMAMAHARRLCPNAAFLVPRFELYRQVSETVMGLLRQLSPLVEPLSLDEAFVDLAAGPYGELLEAAAEAGTGAELVRALAEDLRADIHAATGLTGSVGLAGCKLLAKIASEEAKPDGLAVVEPGSERAVLGPMPVRALPGVGPATAETLRRAGLAVVADVAAVDQAELVRLLGKAHGASLHAMALGLDDRPVVADRDAKSVSVEDTFEVDLVERDRIIREVDRLAERCVRRLRAAGRSGRTVVVKVRRFDFSTLTRSETLRAPTDDPSVIAETARRLVEQVEVTGGVRLLGVGVSGLADFTQEDLFAQAARLSEEEADGAGQGDLGDGDHGDHGGHGGSGGEAGGTGDGRTGGGGTGDGGEAAYGGPGAPRAFHPGRAAEPVGDAPAARRWLPGYDVQHAEFGPGWVQGSGVGRVTVRFETPGSAPGRVRTFLVDDPDLQPAPAPPLPATAPGHPVGHLPG
ncbi:DNA polymerase IV [Peterkaempfera bronchialis]|uniref:DNA polymerase IV n=1 Tax=Peterkaempfera bronchialis TaxID=2126346 RepID=A0A345SSA2_9ACTN|nr:DNA polymerase IV [Peterkaempfera bronchialis]AXI76607.1 DNA polymerase IV [Peterkaempfera bronchialis]